MNDKLLRTNEKARLNWALEQIEKKGQLPQPNGHGILYKAYYKYGRVELKAFKVLGEGNTEPPKRNYHVPGGVFVIDTVRGRSPMLTLEDEPNGTLYVKDRVQHHFELYP